MLEHLFGSTTRVKLLRAFYTNPERAYFVRELSRAVDTQLNAVRRELLNLVNLGMIKPVEFGESKEEEIGTERSKYYKVDTEFFLFEEMTALLNKTQLAEEKNFVEMLKKRAGKLKLLVMSGIFTGDTESGTDILLVGDVKVVPLAKAIRDFEKFMNRPIRYTVLDEKEFSERREIGDRFLYGVLEGKRVIALDEYNLG